MFVQNTPVVSVNNRLKKATFTNKPISIIPKSFATESLLANIILGKYQYAMPLYRQESLFTQSGIELSRTTMARWIIQVSEKFKPLYQALKAHLLEQMVVQADETPLNVLKENKQCYMWLYCSGADSPEAKLHIKSYSSFCYCFN
jgi:transposase